MKIKCLLSLICLCGIASGIFAQEEEDKTNSPYFYVSCPDSTVDRLPLKHTSATVSISGVIADVTVCQTYCNEGENVLEAIYVFPASTRAAVYGMNMTIGNRILYAKIMEKGEARDLYEEAKEEGKTTSLLEEERPNVFRMNVANILPGDTINIEMKYTELLVPTEGVYEFVYPTVVGPRYVSHGEDSASTAFAGTPFTREGEAPLYDFSMDVGIRSGMSIKEITCPSHDSVRVENAGDHASVSLLSKKEGNRDFVLKYILSGESLESGLLLFEGEDENFFLAMIQPPATPTEADIPPREYVFIMDVSGSMNGFPIGVSKTLMSDLLENIRETDMFNIVFFAGGSRVFSPNSLPATPENRQAAIDMVDSQVGSGATQLLNALGTALGMTGTEDFSRSFIIATDGYVSVEREAFDLIRQKLGDANFFPFGIGSSPNRYIIEGIAHVGATEPFIALNETQALEMAERFRQYVQYPVLTNIESSFEGFEVYDVEPLTIPDVLAQRPIIIYGKWRGYPSGSIHLSGTTGNSTYQATLDVAGFQPSEENSPLRYLWARKRIQLLDDYNKLENDRDSALIREITALGLKYNLLTSYTSFIAVDSIIRNEDDTITTVIQPLPLPEGVPDEAIGNYPVGYADLSLKDERGESSAILSCYPNPFSETLTIVLETGVFEAIGEVELRISDALGRTVFSSMLGDLPIEKDKAILKLDLPGLVPSLKSGLYLIAIQSGGKPVGQAMVSFIRN